MAGKIAAFTGKWELVGKCVLAAEIECGADVGSTVEMIIDECNAAEIATSEVSGKSTLGKVEFSVELITDKGGKRRTLKDGESIRGRYQVIVAEQLANISGIRPLKPLPKTAK